MDVQIRSVEYLCIGIAFLAGNPTWTSLVEGSLILTLGIFLMGWSQGYPRPTEQSGERGTIQGPWQFMRHPEILGRFLIVFGAMLVARSWWVFAVSSLVLGYLYRRLVSSQDAAMASWIGPGFVVYRHLVPSVLPQFISAKLTSRLIRLPDLMQRNWSIKRLLRQNVIKEVFLWHILGIILISVSLYYEEVVIGKLVFGALVTLRSAGLVLSAEPIRHFPLIQIRFDKNIFLAFWSKT
jgi:hypothetical protein